MEDLLADIDAFNLYNMVKAGNTIAVSEEQYESICQAFVDYIWERKEAESV